MSPKKFPIHVFVIAAVNANGLIAERGKEPESSTKWTSKEDKKWFWKKTREAKALVMGSKTFATIGSPLRDRKIYILTNNPTKYTSEDNLEFLTATPAEVVTKVGEDGFTELAVSGGNSVYTAFLSQIQTLYLTRETSIKFEKGLPLFDDLDLDGLNAMLEKDFELVSSKKANDKGTIFEEWQRKKS